MGEAQTYDRRTAGLLIAAIVGVTMLLAIVVGGGDDSFDPGDFAPAAEATLPPDSQPSPAAEPATDGPQVPPVDCRSLLTQEERDEALGTWERDVIPSSVFFEGNESCSERFAEEDGFFVRIEPGSADDFQPDARLLGVSGQPIAGVGDGAVWFSGEASDGSELRVLSVRQAIPTGVLVYRVALGRPDLDDPTQLEITKSLALSALPRFPEVELAAPEPTVITFEHLPQDRSDMSFVDNLEARQDGGEWTLGEGLVATLRYFVGDAEAAEVLRHSEVFDASGTGVIRLAREYENSGPDSDARAEVSQLLAQLVRRFEPPEPPSDEGESAGASASPKSAGRSVSVVSVAQEEPECVESWFGLACVVETGSILLDDQFGGGKYRLFHPETAEGPVAGWDSDHIAAAADAMEAAALIYELFTAEFNGMPSIELILTPLGSIDAHSDTSNVLDDNDTCLVSLNTPLQSLPELHFQQRIAAEMAFCLIDRTFPTTAGGWWTDALSIYLSDVVFFEANLEHKDLPGLLATSELETTILDRRSTNWIFFEHLHGFLTTKGIFELIESLPPLSGFEGVEDLLHTFAQGLTDISVPDQTPGQITPYEPESRLVEITGPTVVIEDPLPFGVFRMHASVPPGETACVEYEQSGEFTWSWRPEPPGAWAALPAELTGESIYLVTASKPGAQFTMTVTEVTEDDCEEDPDDTDASDCLLDLICGPSGYYVVDFEVVPSN